MTQIITIANEKGGVAKTTTAISLGGALVETGREVLLIDLDAQANLTIGLGVNPLKVRRSITDVLMNSATILSASQESAVPGLDLVPSNPEMGLAERFLSIRMKYEYILHNALTGLESYDYIILDCPPSLGAVTTNALTAANLVIVPTQPEYFSIYGLRGVTSVIQRVRNKHNPGLDHRILITMMDRRNRIHQTLCDQLRTNFVGRIYQTVIETDTKLRETTVAGLPITHYFPRTRSAMQYRALISELIPALQEENAQRQDIEAPSVVSK